MQLTRHTDYALRVLLFVAVQPEGGRTTVSEISERFEVPRNHMVKIVHRLGRLGYLTNRRGKGGGIWLAVAPEEINLGEVVRNMEPTLDVIDCTRPWCPVAPACRLKPLLDEARDAFLAVLDRYTLADIVQNEARLRTLLQIEPHAPDAD